MTQLEEIIRAEIGQGPMRFDRFMELALYQPGLGYYAKSSGPSPIGRTGDFYTSVSAGPLFGRLLARQFLQMWQMLGQPRPFWIIEQGAHDGQLAGDILAWCRAEVPEFLEAIHYGIVQLSGTAKIQQQCGPEADLLSYITWFENLEALSVEKPIGVFFSNELIDAFPVRVIFFQDGSWRESHVILKGDDLGWAGQPIEDEELLQAIKNLNLPRIEGYTTEINLRAHHWMREVARAMQRGYVLTIDYGFPASVYYAAFRTHGTLTAYVKHHAVDDVLVEPGLRDLTAHVDFTTLARVGESAGLSTLAFVDQQRFLMGIAHSELSGGGGPQVKLQDNLRAWNTLTHPDHLGATFYALLQVKDAPSPLDCMRFARPGGLE